MFRSIRWTLQLWHAGLLATVLLAFGAMTFFEIRRARFGQIDAELERTVQLIAAGVRPPRMMRFEGRGGPDGGGGPDGRGGPDRRRFDQQRPEMERAPLQLRLSPALEERFEKPIDGAYFIIWDAEGRVVGSAGEVKDVPRPKVDPKDLPPQFRPGYQPGSPPEGDRPPGEANRPPGEGGPPPENNGPPPAPPAPQPPTFRQRDSLREAVFIGNFGTATVVGKSVAADRDELRRLGLQLIATGAAVLAVGLMGGLVLASRVIRPIKTITKAAKAISVKNLSARIDVSDTESELGQLAEVLNTAFSRLDDAFRQQVRFTADASHELRTPLAVMHTATQLSLSRDRSTDEYKKTLQTCQRASTRMKDLVDSLLLLAGADAGRLTLEKKVIDLADVARDGVELLTPLAEEKGVLIEVDTMPASISGDATRLDQVVTNLVSNAIRYNKAGGSVRVTVTIEKGEAVLRVIDTGIGIPADHQPHVFERFYRVDAARTRAEGGSGLGLAIGRSIVVAHGGVITFESEEGKGTTFTVRLPIST